MANVLGSKMLSQPYQTFIHSNSKKLYQAYQLLFHATTVSDTRYVPGNWVEQYRLGRALLSCTDAQDPLYGSSIHARLVKAPHEWSIPFSLLNKVLNMYAQCRWYMCMHRLFNEMPMRDIVSHNTVLSECLHDDMSCDISNVLLMYCQMLNEQVVPNSITFSLLLKIIRSFGKYIAIVEQLHCHILKFLLGGNEFIGGSLVNVYTRCGKLESAIRAFEEIEKLDVVSWNIMIDACARSENLEHAVRIFSWMRHEGENGSGFDYFSLTSVIKTCLGPVDLNLGMQLHDCTLKVGLDCDLPVVNALITMYSKCEMGMESAAKVFLAIQNPNIISWTAMISGFSINGVNEEAFKFYIGMLKTGLTENEFSFASVLPVIGSLACIGHGRQVHARIIKSRFSSDVGVGNALIDMYFKCGSLEDAQLAFETMVSHDKVSWTVMIAGYGHHGKGRESIKIFRAMGPGGFKPDEVTFLSVLAACSHGGLLDEGLQIFHSMNKYNIKPNRKHCACIIDLLGRARKFEEAESFIREVGMELDPLAWESLLGTCEIHGEIDIGKRSAEKIMELQPNKDGPYVSLSNMFAERTMWEEKIKMRQKLNDSGFRKEVAYSWCTSLEV